MCKAIGFLLPRQTLPPAPHGCPRAQDSFGDNPMPLSAARDTQRHPSKSLNTPPTDSRGWPSGCILWFQRVGRELWSVEGKRRLISGPWSQRCQLFLLSMPRPDPLWASAHPQLLSIGCSLFTAALFVPIIVLDHGGVPHPPRAALS